MFLNASLLITGVMMMVNQGRKEPEGISSDNHDYHLVHFLGCGGTHLNQVNPWPVQLYS